MVESMKLAIFECRNNQNVGAVLLNGIGKYVPNINPSDILNLNFDVQEEWDFPLVWCTAPFLMLRNGVLRFKTVENRQCLGF